MYVMQFWEIRSNKRMVTSYSIKYQDAPFRILDQFYTRGKLRDSQNQGNMWGIHAYEELGLVHQSNQRDRIEILSRH